MNDKIRQALMVCAVSAALVAGGKSLAQPPGPGGPGPGGGNFDPKQFQEQMMQRASDYLRDRLSVTNDQEWGVLQPRLAKVMQLRFETMMASMAGLRGMGGPGGNRGGGNNGPNGGRFAAMMGASSPEVDALQKAVDDRASASEIKAALARLREARKRKEEDLARAADQLREILTFRQEAILVSIGLLD